MASPVPPPPPLPGQTNLGMAPNIAGMLCYAPCCIGLVFSVVAAVVEKQSRFVRYHAFQSLLLHGAWFAMAIAVQIFGLVLSIVSHGLSALVSILFLLVGLGMFGLIIILMIKANSGEEFELPVIGAMARKWA